MNPAKAAHGSKRREALLYATVVSDSTVSQIIADASRAGHTALSEIEAKRIVGALGINVAIPVSAATADEAAAAAARQGFPVVLKVLSPEVSHKSEVGGVELDLNSAEEVRAAFARIEENLAAKAPGAKFEGTAVQPMAAAGGVELIAGIVA